MTNYTRLLSNLEELQLNRIKDNLDVNSQSKFQFK